MPSHARARICIPSSNHDRVAVEFLWPMHRPKTRRWHCSAASDETDYNLRVRFLWGTFSFAIPPLLFLFLLLEQVDFYLFCLTRVCFLHFPYIFRGYARSFSRPHILPQVSSQTELLADLLRKGGM